MDKSGSIIGMDLGTTFSMVSRLDFGGNPQVITDSGSKNSVASMINFDSDPPRVGHVVRDSLGPLPNTFRSFKRDMGLNEDDIREKHDHVYPYVLSGKNPHGKDKVYSPEQLSSIILLELKNIAGASDDSGSDVTSCVVTVPADFGQNERQATMNAAKRAGLPNIDLIDEPTAAGIFYAFANDELPAGIFAVYDLGGGTFDCTILKTNGLDEIEVLCSKGNQHLGGDDFDQATIDLVKEKFQDKTGRELSDRDFDKRAAEEVKITLSSLADTMLRVAGEDIEITREEFEDAISIWVAQAEQLCKAAIEEAARIERENGNGSEFKVRTVVLAGGSTRIPQVEASVENVFDLKPERVGNVDEVVSLGAVTYAGIRAYRRDPSMFNPDQQAKFKSLTEPKKRTTKSYGTYVHGGEAKGYGEKKMYNAIVIPTGTRYPKATTETFYTMHDNQTAIDCGITEATGNEENPEFTHVIADVELQLPPGRPANRPVQFTYDYDDNQLMVCTIVDLESGRTASLEVQLG